MRSLFVLLIGCLIGMNGCSSPDQIIRVGQPSTENSENEKGYSIQGSSITQEIKDEEKVNRVKVIFESFKSIEEPTDITFRKPNVFFEVYEPNNSVSVHQAYLWYKAEGGAVTSKTTNENEYYEITAEQASTLKDLFNH
ncbi:hypothetical protein VKA52_14645 [Halobacillus sp. HZG1]|uniref:hypothetical protein n=1 Tax=Halobacillus sp. HZG1 TaxID=3111769 RepID=UPI002DC00F75|nr:hypothetical protein [Halobacillus sp. HZG1]MEC3884972.1 hypothetical protein [Halobacillus sp. HZG1]